jgi:hypothetical protein
MSDWRSCNSINHSEEGGSNSVTLPGRRLFKKACLIEGHVTLRGSMANFFMGEVSVVRLIPMRAPPVGTCYSPACDFQDADNLVAVIGFVRAGGVSDAVAEFSGRSAQRRAMSKDHRTFDEVFQLANVSRPMPTREFPQGRAGIDSICFRHRLKGVFEAATRNGFGNSGV